MEKIKIIIYQAEWIYEADYKNHKYKGSLKRHLIIENALIDLRYTCIDYDATFIWKIIQPITDFLLGLNCNFPINDVMKYVVFRHFRGLAL